MSVLGNLEYFHFLRPWWLLAILPACFLSYYFWQRKSSALNWRGAIDAQLLSHLIEGKQTRAARWPWLILFSAWLLAITALAGPSWEKLPQPVHQRQDALVIILDLSLSMLAEDIKPSRLIRARHKILDILKIRKEGLTALIAYSGDAHIVTPLTDDTATIANLVPALSPGMMPVFGSDPVAAVGLAKQLFINSGINNGRVLLITDSIREVDSDDIGDSIRQAGHELSIMGIASNDGAPIPATEGFLKDNNGNIIIPKLHRQPLEQLAKNNDGRYTDVSLTDDDLSFLLASSPGQLDDNNVLTEREFDQWLDRGPLLALLLLPLALFAFRRGWLLLLPLFILIEPQPAQALEWQDLWQRQDQQAAKVLSKGDAKAAAELFKDPQWRATAQYQAGEFKSAVQNFQKNDTANAHYNRGNALAKAGKFPEAIKAYDSALQLQADMDDAQFNRELLEKLQQQDQEKSQDQDQEKQDQEPSEDQQDGDQQDSENSDQQPEDSSSEDSKQDQDEEQSDNSEQQPSEKDTEESPEQPEEQPEEQSEQQSDEQAPDAPEEADQQPQNAEAQSAEEDPQSEQEKQAMEQWLRKIPDEPSGLLRRKFDYEHRLRQQQGEPAKEQPQW